MNGRLRRTTILLFLAASASVATLATGAAGGVVDDTDPARNVALPCESIATAGGVPRAAKNIVHLANVCGVVGTDVELQSRTDARGRVRDYAFLGTMGAGPRIFDVTDPKHPVGTGGYVDSGWENDIQVRGNLMLATFDGVNGEDSSASTCLKTNYPEAHGQGVDVYRLVYDKAAASFDVQLITCVADPPGGAHNASIHPSGNWFGISDCCSDWAIDVIDVRGIDNGKAVHRYRLIDETHAGTTGTTGDERCPANATFKCIVMRRPGGKSAAGLWRPHDIHFSSNGRIAYVAAINSTWIVDVSQVLGGVVKPLAIISNTYSGGSIADPHNIEISHQADVTHDGKILVVSDERGGGLTNTDCNLAPQGVLGGLHFFAVAPITGLPKTGTASSSHPVPIGQYYIPNPLEAYDPLQSVIATLPRAERACTAHVFRLGGNGSTSPEAIQSGYDGVSRLGIRRMSEAWYGAGVWMIDFSGAPKANDGVAEDPRTTWGNTIAWNVMPGADTWSAKEYKGAIYAGDMLRGFDVYKAGTCTGAACAQ
jgi:hypothetical protein